MFTKRSKKNEKGQGLVEYALILVLVAVVVIVILALLGPSVGKIFSNVVDGLEGTPGAVAQEEEEEEEPIPPSSNLGVRHEWANCPGACVTNTYVTCAGQPATPFRIDYFGTGHGGDDGTQTFTCPAGGERWTGNFYPGTPLTVTNLDTGGVSNFTVPTP